MVRLCYAIGDRPPSTLLTLGMKYADHNILFVPYFAADEAQTLDAVLRNDQSVIEGMSDPISECLS
jgi:hypothetical protein